MTQRYSHSALQLYRLCPLRFKGHYIDYLEPLQAVGRHDLDFGAAWHAGLAIVHRKGSIAEAREAFTAAYPESTYPNPLPSYRGSITGKSFSNGLAALCAYRDRWEYDDQFHEVLSVEEYERTDEHALKLDLVTRDTRDGQVYGWDNKATSSYLNNDYWQRFDPDSQVRFYTDKIKARYAEFDIPLSAGEYTLVIKGGSEGTPQNGFSAYSSTGFYAIDGEISGGVTGLSETRGPADADG